MPDSQAPDGQTIVDLEKRFWQALVDKDVDAATALISDSALVVNPMGTMRITPESYGDMVRHGSWTLDGFEFSDAEVIFPTEGVALLTYKAHQKGEMNGEKMDLRCADSSVWVRKDDRWTCAMHTETVLGHMPLTN